MACRCAGIPRLLGTWALDRSWDIGLVALRQQLKRTELEELKEVGQWESQGQLACHSSWVFDDFRMDFDDFRNWRNTATWILQQVLKFSTRLSKGDSSPAAFVRLDRAISPVTLVPPKPWHVHLRQLAPLGMGMYGSKMRWGLEKPNIES